MLTGTHWIMLCTLSYVRTFTGTHTDMCAQPRVLTRVYANAHTGTYMLIGMHSSHMCTLTGVHRLTCVHIPTGICAHTLLTGTQGSHSQMHTPMGAHVCS